MKTALIALLALVLVLAACTQPAVQEEQPTTDTPVENTMPVPDAQEPVDEMVVENTMPAPDALEPVDEMIVVDDTTEPDVTFVLTGENFAFFMDSNEAPELRVKQGQRVRIEFTSTAGFHDWVLDEFNAATERVQEGETTSVEFVAEQAGTFEYYCSVGSHRANGMFGSFVVE